MLFDDHNLVWGLSEKDDGSMKLQDDDNQTLMNRQKFFAKHNISHVATVTAGLAHGRTVAVVSRQDAGQIIKQTDGLITDVPGLTLTVTVADCLPIYFFDPQKQVIGLAHAGWRGLSQNIIRAVLDGLQKNFNCQVANLLAYIGPHIKKCHFEIKADRGRYFQAYPECLIKKDRRIFLDLTGLAEAQLKTAGLLKNNIASSNVCTFEAVNKYFSWRRDPAAKIQAMIAYIGLPPKSHLS
ncbi:MAG TPA: peptidoglycan editing factor PgeF [Candidatus Komeilibacteria bacterium]|nr:MAG: hypothetical protein UW98_C0023G0003 [Parcubacteria group bacterium GW2011_GWC2_45_15]HBV02111.1 peptidoglycan editing factor PgeF [Candidatus Komeilibacteria bacterium]